MITREEFLTIMPRCKGIREYFLDPINDAMKEFGIISPERMAAFLAQVAHESGELFYMEELATGSDYDTRKYLGNLEPEAIRIAKENNTSAGRFYKGHGPIQITGYYNYVSCGIALKLDLANHPKLLIEPRNGMRSAAWFFDSHGLNEIADLDTESSFKIITQKINGGLTHFDERLEYWVRAKEVIGS